MGSGVSNTLSWLPSGSTVTLSWGAIYYDSYGNLTQAGSPTIDIFQAADADGGVGYSTDLTTAAIRSTPTSVNILGGWVPVPILC